MKLSIILPIYNVEDFLEECLDSLVNQNYSSYEVIAINDGSTDNSLKILRKYEKKYPKLIKVIDKENGGLSAARNDGIKLAQGEYLFFVDSDDCILPNSLEILGKYLHEDYDVIEYPFMVGTSIDNSKLDPMFNNTIEDIRKRMIVGKPCAQNKICRKTLFEKNKIEFLKGVYYEDLATTPKLALYTNKIKFIDEPLYFYRIRENSIITNKDYNPKVDAIFPVLKQLKEHFKNKYPEEIEYLHIEHLLRSASIRYFDFGTCQEQLDKIVNIMKENYPKWNKNKYYQKESIKKRIICRLFYNKQYKLISLLRKI